MIGLAVWRLDGEAMNPWRCRRCEAHGVRPHSIDADDPDADADDVGAFLLGYQIAPTARGALEDAQLRECPEHAFATWCAELLQLWRLTDGDIGRAIHVMGGEPSAAFIDAWDCLAAEMGALRKVLRDRAGEGG